MSDDDKKKGKRKSRTKDTVSGGVQGASMGAVAGPYGALAGGVVGGGLGYMGMMPGTGATHGGEGDLEGAFQEVGERYAAYRPEHMAARQQALQNAMSFFGPQQQALAHKYGTTAVDPNAFFQGGGSGGFGGPNMGTDGKTPVGTGARPMNSKPMTAEDILDARQPIKGMGAAAGFHRSRGTLEETLEKGSGASSRFHHSRGSLDRVRDTEPRGAPLRSAPSGVR